MSQLYVLFEHAVGFTLFRTTEFEEIGVFIPQVRRSITDVSKFRGIVHFVSFQPFQSQKEALLNMKLISAGQLSMDLKLFLENNVPRAKKTKQKVVLGVQDPSLASEISEKLDINCNTSGIVKEILRGIRHHYNKLVKGFKNVESASRAQLALAHNYSREKVNFDATRQDSMIIQSHAVMDELEKDINILSKRIREWYSFHFPELFSLVDGNVELFVKCIKIIGDRKQLAEDAEDQLKILFDDPSKVESILQAAHTSMGMDITEVDLENMKMFCDRILCMIKKREDSENYLKSKMRVTAPSVSKLVGELIGSRLIARAGGIMGLAKLPASTVQVLGADKKLFRAVKGKEKADSCGFISKSAFVGRMGKTRKGHLARILSNKCSLAARVDCFSKEPKSTFGPQLIQDVERIVKLHKLFKKNVVKQTSECKANDEGHAKVKKRSRGKKRKMTPQQAQECSTLNGTVEDSRKEEVGEDIEACDLATEKSEKRKSNRMSSFVSDSIEKVDISDVIMCDVNEDPSLFQKTFSQDVKHSSTEDQDEEQTEFFGHSPSPKKLRKSTRLAKRKSIRT